MESITYNLLRGQSSDQYYQDISTFTDYTIQLLAGFQGVIKSFRDLSGQRGTEDSDLEYGLELLTIGILWQVYGPFACREADSSFPQQEKLHFRVQFQSSNLKQLLKWLLGTGEFTETTKRLQAWAAFLSAQAAVFQERILKEVSEVAARFTTQGKLALGVYTKNVASFLEVHLPAHLGKEDYVFCGRREEEYHLNMVGAEIMNRAFQSSFLLSKRKAVLIPICLRQPKTNCQMQECSQGEYHCRGCSEACPVNKVTSLGEEDNFQVVIIPHESMVFAGNNAASVFQNTGVVGVACVTTLLENGWKAKALGIPVQCVPLDYSGCKSHWHSGISTNLNLKELSRILDI
mgnify:CR=1 FL=1|jgi:hypothetical protein